MGVKKLFMKTVAPLGGGAKSALVDPGRLFYNTKAQEIAAEQAKAASAERAMYEQQQRQLQEANTLDASKVLDSVAKIETGAGTDVSVEDIALGPKKKRNQSTSTSLGVQ